MAVLLKRLMLQTINRDSYCIGRCFAKHTVQKTALAQSFLVASAPKLPCLVHAKGFSTAEDTHVEKKNKKRNDTTFSNVGRKIGDRIVHLFDENGNDLGNMHRADVIRLLDERGLRLVQRSRDSEPPEYQLMTGEQIHQERLHIREREKAKPKTGPTVTKELIFSSNIEQHDLDTKSKQIQQWIEKNYQVQITIKGKNEDMPENKMEEICNKILQTMPGIATFSSRPQAIKGGKALMCVLRHLSKKEEKAYRDSQETKKRDALKKESGNERESDVLHQ